MKYVYKKKLYIFLVPLIDAIGGIVFSFRFLFKKHFPEDIRNILVVRLDHIGDFVCTTPLFKNLKNKFPDSKITVLVNSVSKELAYADPNIDKVITFSPFYLSRGDDSSWLKGLMRAIKDVKNIGFDLGIEPRGDLLSIMIMWLGGVKYRAGYGITGGAFLLDKESRYDKDAHVIDRNLALLNDLNIPVTDKSPSVYFNEKDATAVEGLIKGINGDSKGFEKGVVLHPFAGAKAKEWSQGNFQELIDRLKKNNLEILLIGSDRDEGRFSNIIDLRGKLNLPQVAFLIKKAGFFIGLDSGPANIAAALNVPSVVICSGTNVPQLWIPNNGNVKFVYKNTGCRPCENKACPEEKGNICMTSISVDDVLNKFKEIHEGIF